MIWSLYCSTTQLIIVQNAEENYSWTQQVKYAATNEGDKDGIENMFTGTYKDGLVDFSCDNSIDILGNIRSYGN